MIHAIASILALPAALALTLIACGDVGQQAIPASTDSDAGFDGAHRANEGAVNDAARSANEGAVDDGATADTTSGDAAPVSCNPDSVTGIQVATLTGNLTPFDPLGYPAYAIDRCTLAYVAPPAQGQVGGELRLRHLGTGVETQLAPADEQPRRPSIAGDLVVWEALVGGKSSVRVSNNGHTTTIVGPFDHAGEPRVTSDAVVFTAWLSPDDAGDTDVYLYTPSTQQGVAIATGPGQQRFADVSTSLVAVSDFSEDPAQAFDPNTFRLADIVVFDRRTLAKTVRHLPGKQAFPMLGVSSRLGYLDWGLSIPEPKFSAYSIRVGTVAGDPSLDGNVKGSGQVQVNTPYVRPSTRGDWVEWVDESGGGGLFRRPLDLSLAMTSTLDGLRLLGPVAGQPLTIVAASTLTGFELRAVAR